MPRGEVALARASLVEIVRKAAQMRLRQIAENAGEDGAVI